MTNSSGQVPEEPGAPRPHHGAHGSPPPGPGPYGPHGPYGPAGPYGGPPPGGVPPYGFGPLAPQPGIIPLRPLVLPEIYAGVVNLLRANPQAVLAPAAIIAAITTFIAGVVQYALVRQVPGNLPTEVTDPESLRTMLNWFSVVLLGQLLAAMVAFAGGTVYTGVLSPVLGRSVLGGRMSLGEAWRATGPRVAELLGLAVVELLLFVLPAGALLGATLLLGSSGLPSGQVAAGTLLLLLLGLAYLAYVLFLVARLAVTAPALALEGLGVTGALRRSWRLVQGGSWRVLGIVVLTNLIAGLLGSVVLLLFRPFEAIEGIGTAVSFVGAAVSTAITYALQAGVTGVLYTDRRMRAEGFDTALRTAAEQNERLGWVPATVDDLWRTGPAGGAGRG